jgi:replicative superfamily II helicase
MRRQAERKACNVIVTTPEKWDVVTRKTAGDPEEAVGLVIIDEVTCPAIC